ncbi:hypothetical protein IFR04_011279, partial [Cadophora malorum]
MFSTTYDEKAAYEQRYHSHSHPLRANPNSYSHSHSRNTSSTSTTSTSSSSSSNRYDSEAPPPYTYIFYNSIGEKPLPPLPASAADYQWRGSSVEDREGENARRVRFVLEKPLPPLPVEELGCEGVSHGEGGVQNQDRKRRRSSASERSARMGECAWWTKEVGESA